MKTKSRIASILTSTSLDASITGFEKFDLAKLALESELEFPVPTNVRLGHLAERVVSKLIKASTNFNVVYENVQLVKDQRTIGEIDFILEEVETERLIHMELAYKFYLFDPSISSEPVQNWIGPNRKDSLIAKLDKLERKQFPLLHHHCAKLALSMVDTVNVSQALCLLASLFVPFGSKVNLSPDYSKAIKGEYLNFKTFLGLDHAGKLYAIPDKKEWGMQPGENEVWMDSEAALRVIEASIKEKQAPLCWKKQEGSYSEFFVVWW